MTDTTVRRVITPNDLSIRDLFSRAKSFHIDIYQREYKWKAEQVEALLRDLELRFDMHQRTETDFERIQQAVQEHFQPYYLNTFLTHTETTGVAIVDGQQRLTTLLLMLIKLRNVLKRLQIEPNNQGNMFSPGKLEKLIYEPDDRGRANRFKIFNENRELAFRAILEQDTTFEPDDETQSNILSNYEIISKYFDSYFALETSTSSEGLAKVTYYIYYILERISIVEIKIEDQQNVAMIFEVVNDRGLGLKPHEILKGKLIGSLPKNKKESANQVWADLTNRFFNAAISFDEFLQTYFRSKFSDTTSYIRFSDDRYHFEIQKNKGCLEHLANFQNNDRLYEFVTQELKFFGELYLELRTTSDFDSVTFNRLNGQNQQFLLILSAVKKNDPLKENKVKAVSKKFDQFFTILTLLEAFDSRDIQPVFHAINTTIREADLDTIESAFAEKLLEVLVSKEVIQNTPSGGLKDIFRFELFKGITNSRHDFSKYVLMRIDRHIAQCLDIPGYMSCSLEELEERFQTRRKYGLHLEHILAHNAENHQQFEDPETGLLDEEKFNRTRNLLGMVLLLKDRQNESSNNETYTKKVERYKTSNFLWNQLLVGHLDVVDYRNVPGSWAVKTILPTPENCFPEAEFKDRQKAVFALIEEIWNF